MTLAHDFVNQTVNDKKDNTEKKIKTTSLDNRAHDILNTRMAQRRDLSKKDWASWLIKMGDEQLTKVQEERDQAALDAPVKMQPRKAG